MKRRSRDRRGRFLKKGQSKSRARGRRRSTRGSRRRKNAPRRARRRRSHARSHNPPRRRRRSSARRSGGKVRYRTRTVVKRGRRSNPPFTIKTAGLMLVTVGAGFVAASYLPGVIIKIAKKPEWSLGWKPVALSAGCTIVAAGIGYGLMRLISSKRNANMVAGSIAVGGALATGVEAVRVYKATRPAPAPAQPNPMLPGGPRGFSPQQLADAERASRVLGMAGFSPQQFAGAGSTGALFGRESFGG